MLSIKKVEIIIHINNFSARIGNFKLKNIELEIYKNEIFAILGKTGSGKTLLLEAAAGFYKGASGTISINGTNVMNIPPEKRQIGFVYQDYALFPHMTVYDNIGYGLKMHKAEKIYCKNTICEIAELLCISPILTQYPQTLSGGERQRTALARALVLNPEILLMDEPFSALDPNTKNQMYKLIHEIHQKFECTILFVTHDFNEAQIMADRIGIMANGELKAIRKADELFNSLENEDKEITDFLGGNKNDSQTSLSNSEGRINENNSREQFIISSNRHIV